MQYVGMLKIKQMKNNSIYIKVDCPKHIQLYLLLKFSINFFSNLQ